MREKLADREGLRGEFAATYKEPGERTSRGYIKPMLLFVNVCDEQGEEVTDHLWFAKTPSWDALNLQPRDRVKFEARVSRYMKGYHDNRQMDFKLAYPRHIRVLSQVRAGAVEIPAKPARPSDPRLMQLFS